jgi:hypothetical protein
LPPENRPPGADESDDERERWLTSRPNRPSEDRIVVRRPVSEPAAANSKPALDPLVEIRRLLLEARVERDRLKKENERLREEIARLRAPAP